MSGASRLGDKHSGHGCFSPTPCISASSNVKVNGMGAMRVGDQFAPHSCPKPHPVKLAMGSSTVLVNGKPFGRIGDMTACGATVITGSGNVIVGG